MTTKYTGGAAFPFVANDLSNVALQSSGMTLRDWFAGQVISSVKAWHPADRSGKSSAVIAYEIADAMIRARGEA